MPAAHEKTHKQIRYLLSQGSPLTPAQKAKLQAELEEGIVRVKKEPEARPA